MIEKIILAVAITGAALGSGFLTAWLLLACGELVARIRQMYRPRWQNALQTFFAGDQADTGETSKAAGKALEALVFLPGLAGLVVAVLMRDLLLSPYLAFLGIGLSWYLRERRVRKVQSALTSQVRNLVVLFRSRFVVGESPFSVLAELHRSDELQTMRSIASGAVHRRDATHRRDLPAGAVAQAVEQAVNTYQTSGSVEQALAPLRVLKNAHLARLAMILEASGSASTEVVVDEVKHIEDDLKARDRLAGQAKASLALLKGTVRFLQAVNLTVVAAAVALPMWRDFFTSTLQRRGTFLAATLFVLMASVYFDQEIGMQEEKAL